MLSENQATYPDILYPFNCGSIQIDNRQRLLLGGINFQMQIQNRAARRINCHYRDRSVEFQQKTFHYRYRSLSLS